MEAERVRRVSLSDSDDVSVTTERRKSVQLAIAAAESERARRLGKPVASSGQGSALAATASSLLALAAIVLLLAITFEGPTHAPRAASSSPGSQAEPPEMASLSSTPSPCHPHPVARTLTLTLAQVRLWSSRPRSWRHSPRACRSTCTRACRLSRRRRRRQSRRCSSSFELRSGGARSPDRGPQWTTREAEIGRRSADRPYELLVAAARAGGPAGRAAARSRHGAIEALRSGVNVARATGPSSFEVLRSGVPVWGRVHAVARMGDSHVLEWERDVCNPVITLSHAGGQFWSCRCDVNAGWAVVRAK